MKMETIETNLEENNRTIKKQSDSLILLFEEINNLKRHVCLGDDIENKGMRMQDETKNSHINNYNLQKILNSRKLNYYNKIRCDGIASIYRNFLEKEPPFIPRKFREAVTNNMSEQQQNRKKKLEIQRLTYEIEHLEELKEKHHKGLEETDLEIKEELAKEDDPVIRQSIKENWYARIQEEEEKSNTIWEKKKRFFENLPSQQEKQVRRNGTGRRGTSADDNYQRREPRRPEGHFRYTNGRRWNNNQQVHLNTERNFHRRPTPRWTR